MAKQITRWSPDTCECQINILWDTDNPEIQTHEVFNKCKIHEGNSDSDCIVNVLDENRTKNKVFARIREQYAAFGVNNFKWRFDEKRGLIVELDHFTMTSNEKSAIQVILDSFTSRKVTII